MNTPVHLLDLEADEFKKFMNSFDYVFSDCDGVLWEKQALPLTGEFFSLMEKHGKTVHFVSNNSIRSRENYEAKFKDAKIEKGFERLTVPSIAIAEYLKEKNIKKAVYCVTCSETMKMIESEGITCKTGPEIATEKLEEFAGYLKDDPEIGAVVFDCDIKVNLAKIQKAITYLKNPEVIFLTGATDRQIHFKKGCVAVAFAVFTDVTADESGRTPIILSKPSKEFGEFAMKRAGATDPKRVLFIGDMIDQDVGLGKASGFQTFMVLTNLSKETMMTHKTTRPDFYADSLASVVPLLREFKY